MNKSKCFSALMLIFPCALLAAPAAVPQLRSAIVFQNAISAIGAETPVPKQGALFIGGSIEPVGGTLWFDRSAAEVRRIEKVVEQKIYCSADDIARLYNNCRITLTLQSDNGLTSISGTVITPPHADNKSGNAKYIFVKQKNNTVTAVAISQILSINSAVIPTAKVLRTRKQKTPVWEVKLRDGKRPENLTFAYLSRGISWQSSGRITLTGPREMRLELACDLVNNLADLNNAEITLAAGKVNISQLNSTSPMAINNSTAFDAAALHPPESAATPRNASYLMVHRSAGSSSDAAVLRSGESEDIQLFPLGKVSLKKGEVMHRRIASVQCSYERLVIWRPGDLTVYRNTLRAPRNTPPMDAIRFTNPLDLPLPESPLEVVDGNVFIGQNNIPWINRNAEAVVTLGHARTVSTQNLNYEIKVSDFTPDTSIFHSVDRNSAGQIVGGRIAGVRYRFCHIQHELKIKNHRSTPATMVIDATVSGTVSAVNDGGRVTPLSRNFSINPTHNLRWEIDVAPGAEKIIKYRSCRLVQY